MEQANQPWTRFFARHMPPSVPQQRVSKPSFPPVSRRGPTGPPSNQSIAGNDKGGSASSPIRSPRRAMSARNLRSSRGEDNKNNPSSSATSSSTTQPSQSRAVRNEAEYEECRRRIRRLVLLEGVPTDDVSGPFARTRVSVHFEVQVAH